MFELAMFELPLISKDSIPPFTSPFVLKLPRIGIPTSGVKADKSLKSTA